LLARVVWWSIQKQSDLAPSLTVDCLAESANASPITDKSASWLMVNPPKLKGLNRVVGKSGVVVYTETK
jgi:hypothetical protein